MRGVSFRIWARNRPNSSLAITANGLHGSDLKVDGCKHIGPETGLWARKHAGTGLVAETEFLSIVIVVLYIFHRVYPLDVR